MHDFALRELRLLSFVEKAAKSVTFDRNVTVVRGQNDTGKSSLLKSIYYTLGAEPAKTHPRWKAAEPISHLSFSVNGRDYSVLRKETLLALFDGAGSLIKSFTKITEGFGVHLAQLLDFGLLLTDKKGQTKTPPPAYLFLPFYIDQDKSWTSSWNGFKNLGQFPRWRQPVAEYHVGIYPNEYYRLKSDSDRTKLRLEELSAEHRAFESARKRVEKTLPKGTFDISVDDFKKEIDGLLKVGGRLKQAEEEYKTKLAELYNERIALERQIKIVESSKEELAADYRFITRQLPEEEVDCPTCGATYENSFAERFEIAQDEDRCRELLVQLRLDLAHLNERISGWRKKALATREELAAIDENLAEKRGALQLKEVIGSEGRKEVRRIFREGMDSYYLDIRKLERRLQDYSSRIKRIQDKDRIEEIHEFFRGRMRSYLHELAVTGLAESSYKKVWSSVGETGSDLPRALLAYYYSILKTAETYSSSPFCPLVIDSPNQQDQDKKNLDKMIRLIFRHKPGDSQLIIGLGEFAQVDFDATLIELTEKEHLLSEDEYPEVSAHLGAFLDKALSSPEDVDGRMT